MKTLTFSSIMVLFAIISVISVNPAFAGGGGYGSGSITHEMVVGDVDVTMSPPIEGSKNAPITIIEFGDFQCPKCDQWFQNEKPTIKQDYIDTGKANLYFVDFTFLGDDSLTSANASYCAGEQGKYWKYHSHLYNNQGEINGGWASSSNLKMFASEVGLDVITFDECLDSGKYDDRVAYNTNVGASNGVEGTPAFFIVNNSNGVTERIDGPQPSDIFAGVIDGMLGDPVEPALAATEEEITEMGSGVVEQAEDIASETENQIEETTEDIATAVDDRPQVNVDVGDGNNGGGCLI
ncbi:MAG: DsbA family protein, partial [Nitrosopumilus sp.]